MFIKSKLVAGVSDDNITHALSVQFPGKVRPYRVQGVKYVRSNFLKPDVHKYNQEHLWINTPGKMGFVLGLTHARYNPAQIIRAVEIRYPQHIWAAFCDKAECIEFAVAKSNLFDEELKRWIAIIDDPTGGAMVMGAILQAYQIGDVEIGIAQKMEVSIDAIVYVLARFSVLLQRMVGLKPASDK